MLVPNELSMRVPNEFFLFEVKKNAGRRSIHNQGTVYCESPRDDGTQEISNGRSRFKKGLLQARFETKGWLDTKLSGKCLNKRRETAVPHAEGSLCNIDLFFFK